MGWQPFRIAPFCFYGIEADSDAIFIETNLANYTCLGNRDNAGSCHIPFDFQDYQTLLLLRHPIPILAEQCFILTVPTQTCTAVTEHAKCDFGADIKSDDVQNIALTARCDTPHFFMVKRQPRPNVFLKTSCCLLDLRPWLLALLQEETSVKVHAMSYLFLSRSTVCLANLAPGQSRSSAGYDYCTYLVWRPRTFDCDHCDGKYTLRPVCPVNDNLVVVTRTHCSDRGS
jgi:hypothetical protein